MLQQCRRRRRCHLVCVFPNRFMTNIQRHGGDVPAQAARKTPSVKMLFPGLSKIKFGTFDFFLRFLNTTLVRELRFSGQRTPPLCWRSAVLLSVPPEPNIWLHVFALCSPYVCFIIWAFLLCTPRNISGCRDEGGPKTVAATMPPPPPLSPRVFVS